VGLERGPVSLASTIEELLGRKSSGPGLESVTLTTWLLLSANLTLTLLISGGRSVGIVCARTQATEFSSVLVNFCIILKWKARHRMRKDESNWWWTTSSHSRTEQRLTMFRLQTCERYWISR
jgi:hypothetical protein